MTSPRPLHGTELIDSVKASAKKEIKVVSELCGYGQDIEAFERELKKACNAIGLEIEGFQYFQENELDSLKEPTVEIAPETPTKF
jgi:hypothetical protein